MTIYNNPATAISVIVETETHGESGVGETRTAIGSPASRTILYGKTTS